MTKKKKIYSCEFSNPIKITKIDETGIVFDSGLVITDYHQQDCCESVYADWKQLEDTTITDESFKNLRIFGVKEAGISINGYFIPCYNRQNGYYSNELEIQINKGKKCTRLDIVEFVEDDIV